MSERKQTCPRCGYPASPNAAFCGNCGFQLPQQTAPPTSVAAGPSRPMILLASLLICGIILLLASGTWFIARNLAVNPTPAGTTIANQSPATATPHPPASATATPQPTTSPPRPTLTRPAITASATPTLPANTPTARPTLTPPPLPTPIPNTSTPIIITCNLDPGPRWGTTLYALYKPRLGCPATGESRPTGVFQLYQSGLTVWRADIDQIYVMTYDGRYRIYPDTAPDNYYQSDLVKGGFGYLWNSNSSVRSSLGNPITIEMFGTNFAIQDFSGGTIFYFLENEAQNYVLFADNFTWLSRSE